MIDSIADAIANARTFLKLGEVRARLKAATWISTGDREAFEVAITARERSLIEYYLPQLSR